MSHPNNPEEQVAPIFNVRKVLQRFHEDVNEKFGTNIEWDNNDIKTSCEQFLKHFEVLSRDDIMKRYNSPDYILDSRLTSIGVTYLKVMYHYMEPHAYIIPKQPDNQDVKNKYVMVLLDKELVLRAIADNYSIDQKLIQIQNMKNADILDSIEWFLRNNADCEISELAHIAAHDVTLFNLSENKVSKTCNLFISNNKED